MAGGGHAPERVSNLLITLRFATFMMAALAVAGLPGASDASRIQLTDHDQAGCSLFAPVMSADATLVAFESTCDLVGTNADGNREIFQVDDEGTVAQLTSSAGCASMNPASNAAGTVVAFDSDCDLTGGNADRNVEIFLWRPSGVTQLTNTSSCTSESPSIDDSGTRVAFYGDCDLVTGRNVDHSFEIFRTVVGSAATQLTDDRSGSACGSFNPSLTAAGTLATFESDCDPLGTNEQGIGEVFQVTASGVVTQLTASPEDTCLSSNPVSDADGGVVAFESDCDFTGGNADHVVEIFTVTSGGLVTQLSDDDSGGACESTMPAISEDGSAVAFASYCDLTGDNADGSFEVFRSRSGALEQLTDAESCASVSPAVRSSGNLVGWASDCDLTAANPDGSDEIFLDSTPCACGAPVTRYVNGTEPLASDALFTLRAAIGIGTCALCDCDVSRDAKITASDALLILKRAVGQDVPLVCA
jgi:Tol biopolymer transport system component